MKIGTSSTGFFRPGWLERASVLPVYAALASTCVLIWFSGVVEVSYESRVMTVLLNTLGVASASAAGAWLAMRGYLVNGLPELLYAGCGLIAMGSCHLVSSLIIGGAQGPNAAVTVHNLGVFCAAWLHLAAALHAGRPRPNRPESSAIKAAGACLGTLALIGLFWAAAQYDLSPVFYIAGKGTTPVRQLVLILAVALLAVAAAFLVSHAAQRSSLTLRCYGLGLGLIAIGLVDVSIAVPGSVLSWVGRTFQSLGYVYLLAAFMVAIRTAVQKGLNVKEAAAEYYLESEDHYRRLVEALRAAVISLDPQGRVVLWNPQAETVFGYSYVTAAGQPLTSLIAPAEKGGEGFRKALEERSGRYLELTLRRKDGLEIPADVLVFAAAGAWEKWTNLVIRDISDRKQAEAVLRRYELISAHSRDIILHIEYETGRILEANAAAVAAYGYSREELLNLTIQDLRVPESLSQAGAQLAEAERKGVLFETIHRRKDGSTFSVEVSSQGATIGEVRTLVSVIRDISDRERSRTEIAYLASFPRLNPNPIVEVDFEGQVRYCNPAAERLFPDFRQRGKDHPWLSDWRAVSQAVVESGENPSEREVAIGDQWYHQTLIFFPESRSFRIYGLEITRRKQSENALRREQSLLECVTQSTDVMLVLLDPQFKFVWVNPAYALTCKMKPEEMVGKNHFVLYPNAGNEAIFRRVRDTGEGAFYKDKPFVFPDQPERGVTYWNWSLIPVKDPGGHVTGLVFSLLETTRFKLADEALRKSEARFRLLADTAAQLLATSDPQAHVNELAGRVMAHLDCHCFFNFLVEDGLPNRLRLNAWAGIPKEEARQIEWLDYGVAVCGCVARDGVRIVAERIPTTPDVRTELVKSYGMKAYACHPLEGVDGKLFGTLSFGTRSRETFSADDLDLMKAVTDQVAMAIVRMQNERDLQSSADALRKANERLEEKVRIRTQELEDTVAALKNEILVRKKIQAELQVLSRKSLEALEADRRSVARELHDSIGGSLAAIKFGLEEAAEQALGDPVGGVALLGTLVSHLADTIKETKRISANLRPLAIDDLGLLATIEWYTRQFCQRYENIRVVRQIEVEEQEIPEEFKIVFYRVMQEAMTNAAKHSRADTVFIRLKKLASHFEFEVEDNGCGFNPDEVLVRQDQLSGFGLKSMQERAEICGGVLNLHTQPDAGTSVRVALPVGAAASGF